MNPPANWYEDPTGRHGQRYWDGEQWTEHVFTDGVQAVDPLDAGPAQTADDAEQAAVAGAEDVDQASPADDDQLAVDDGQSTGDDADATAPAPLPQRAGHTRSVGEESADAPVDGLFADTASPDASPPVEPAGAMWTPDEAPQHAGHDADVGDAEVAPEIEAEDVVASLDEVSDASGHQDAEDTDSSQEDDGSGIASSPVGDLTDAFVLAPETASRLVGRRQAAQADEPAQEVPAETSEEAPPAGEQPDEHEDHDGDEAPTGAIDAPPPSMPPAEASAALTADGPGITGDLLSGAFAERSEGGPVSLQNNRLLRCAVGDGPGVVARQGTMVAYQGDVSFERQGAGGVARALKRAATGEGLAMMRVEGTGDVFFADGAQHVFLLELDGGPGLSVNGRNVLAFSASLQWDIERVKGATLLAGGLFNTTLTGTGWVALVSDGEPVVLRTDEAATYVDVNALVAWSAGLSTRIVSSATAKSLVGLGSGEAFQMAFDGAGVVIVQPSEGATAGGNAS